MAIVRCHYDADGVTSGYFTTFGVKDSVLEVLDYKKGFGYCDDLSKDDWIVDMKPQNKNFTGHCIDHHFPHPDDRKYELTPNLSSDAVHYSSDIIPASYIAWEKFKDVIPKSEWWKIVIGLVGDGSPELIPNEVFDMHPILLQKFKTSAFNSYGRWKISEYPLYILMSSCINAFLRKFDNESAIFLIKAAQSPLDIYLSEDVAIAKRDVKNEFATVVKDMDSISIGRLTVIGFDSRFRMSGYVSSSLSDAFSGQTVAAINKKTGSLSLRGDLAPYYKNIITKNLDYVTIDGHRKFMGGKVHNNYETFLEDLTRIL